MWSFLKHYEGAQPGKRKTASATQAENVREKHEKEGFPERKFNQGGFSLEKIILRITIYSNIFIFMTVTNNIYQKQIKYHVFNAATNSEQFRQQCVDHKNVVIK
jgi:hypothetical protein